MTQLWGGLRPVACAVVAVCAFSAQAQGQTQGSASEAQAQRHDVRSAAVLKPVVVSASREEQDPDALPISVDVISAEQMEREQIGDIRQLVEYLPNVEVPRSPSRFALAGTSTGRAQNSGFNIRGLEGNRVLMLVDGVRQPRGYGFSANGFGRDYLDLGLVQRVEVLRGAVPALYGSDGMGGLVNFITVQPSDFLKDGKTLGGRASASYDGSNKGKRAGVTLAGQASPEWGWLLSAGVHRADALKSMGTNYADGSGRTAPNPQKDKDHSLLGRLVYTPTAAQKHIFTLEQVKKSADYELLTARGPGMVPSIQTLNSDASTDMNRWRASWQGQWQQLDWPMADELQLMASYQKSDAREWVDETRTTAPLYRVRDVTYDENALQLHAQASKLLHWGQGASGRISYGADYGRNKVVNEQNGIAPPAGESFPLKRFPDTTETSAAIFAQAELNWGPWTVTPGVRAEHYRIDASQNGFLPQVANNSNSAVSPKLGVMFHANDAWSVYGNYAAGFRAPNAGQVNAFFENLAFGYKNIPNPDLRPEKSHTFELGVRGRVQGLRLDVAAFTGRYKDFIEDQQKVSGSGIPHIDPIVYQSINIGRVRIHGVELKAAYDWGHYAGGKWTTQAAYGYTKGKNSENDTPLDSIPPQQLVLGVRYDSSLVGVQFNASHRAAKKVSEAEAGAWLSPASTVLDLTTQWNLRPGTRLNVGVYNLTDKKYWRWTDVRGLAATTVIADAYSQPGRHVRLSLVQEF